MKPVSRKSDPDSDPDSGCAQEAKLIALLHVYLDSKYSKEKQKDMLASDWRDLPKPEVNDRNILIAIRTWNKYPQKAKGVN